MVQLLATYAEGDDVRVQARPLHWWQRFAAGVPYLLPSDLGETNRLDFQHYMLRSALKGNYAAPLNRPRDILDVGAGTGRWAIEMARKFPQANVVGVDTAPPTADAHDANDIRPENYAFVLGNVLERLPFADNSFDCTHQRLLVAAIPKTNRGRAFERANLLAVLHRLRPEAALSFTSPCWHLTSSPWPACYTG